MDSDDDVMMASIPLGKYDSSQSRKKTSWVSSAFDDFGDNKTSKPVKSKSIGDSQKTSAKRKKTSNSDLFSTTISSSQTKESKSDNTTLWAEKYAPTKLSDLAVHKKKVQEVQGWLEMCFSKQNRLCPVLLLTGPSGAGKTATMSVLAREMGYELVEWINPVLSAYEALQEEDRGFGFRPQFSASQSSQFTDFLLRANKYQALQIFSTDTVQRKVILVEDFPNAFYRDSSRFHEIIRQYRQRGRCPLVFIVSDSASGGKIERKLFPKELQGELQIANISFNPVAQTSLCKVLGRIAAAEASKTGGRVLDKAHVESLATASSGDLRGAVNALQFSCLQSKTQGTSRKQAASKSVKRGKKGSKAERPDSKQAAVGEKDTTLFLFRALGKILYCKRGDAKDFPDHLSKAKHADSLYRDPLLFDPEDVIEKCQLTGEFFTAYLHQNYVDFYNELDDIVEASNYISDADNLTRDWQSRSVLQEYSSSVAARGIMFSNSTRALSCKGGVSGLGWKPLHKPQWLNTNKEINSNCEAVKGLFKGHCSTPIELQTQLIPYAALIGMPSLRPGQQHYVTTIGRISKHQRRVFTERLDEKDVATQQMEEGNGEDLAEENQSAVASNESSQTHGDDAVEELDLNEEEEVVIEDFDD